MKKKLILLGYNSTGIIIPPAILEEMEIQRGEYVSFSFDSKKKEIVIKKEVNK